LQLAQRHIDAGHPFWAIHSFRQALASGADDPNTHRKLSQVLYDLGFVDQAVTEMELAINNVPAQDFLHMEMGVYRLAAGQLHKARAEFSRVLELNAGFSYGYYYLAEVYYRLADYDRAALALVLAQQLGFPGFDLQRKLTDLGWQLPQHPWHDDPERYCLRQILLDDKISAAEVMQRLEDGELFEELARQFSKSAEAQSGGYVGTMTLASMPPAFAAKLQGVESFSPPLLLESAQKYIIVQRIATFDPAMWQQTIDNNQQQLRQKISGYTAQAAADNEKYLVLSGVYHNRKYAEQRIARLLALGLKSYLQQRGSGEHLRYEVIAGRFADYTAAEAAGERIKADGLDYYIRHQD
jgi:hypothetical protein